MRQVEQFAGLVVGIDESVQVDIEHDDRFRRVLHQRAISFLVFLERFFRLLAGAHVAQVDDEYLVVTRFQAARIDLCGELFAAFANCVDFTADEAGVRIVDVRHERLQEFGKRLALGLGKDVGDR